jgi:hypothetical protein
MPLPCHYAATHLLLIFRDIAYYFIIFDIDAIIFIDYFHAIVSITLPPPFRQLRCFHYFSLAIISCRFRWPCRHAIRHAASAISAITPGWPMPFRYALPTFSASLIIAFIFADFH